MLTLTQNNYLNLTVLTAMLPLCFAWLATTLAGLLSQDKWPHYVNDGIAIVFVVLASIADVYLTGRLTGDIALIVGTVTATATLLLATSFEPLQEWTDILQKSILVFEESGFHLVAQQPVVSDKVATTPLPPTLSSPPVVSASVPTTTNADGETTAIKTQFKTPPISGSL